MGLWQSKNQIPELNDVTLSGTVSIGNDLGSGAYGKVYSIQYLEKSYAAKQIHPILIEGVNPEDREAIKMISLKNVSVVAPSIIPMLWNLWA